MRQKWDVSVNVVSDSRWPVAGVSCVRVRVWRGASELIGGSGSAGRWWQPPSPSSPPRSPGSGRTPAGLQTQHRHKAPGQSARHVYGLLWLIWCAFEKHNADDVTATMLYKQEHGVGKTARESLVKGFCPDALWELKYSVFSLGFDSNYRLKSEYLGLCCLNFKHFC